MIRHDIIRKYLNLHPDTSIDGQQYAVSLFTINQMLAVIEANEREECAKVCDEQEKRSKESRDKSKRERDQSIYHHCAITAKWNAEIIRAREKI
jgi:hypothetical protein